MDNEKALVKSIAILAATLSVLLPKSEWQNARWVLIPKLLLCGVLYVLLSTIAYDTFMYYDLFKVGSMGKFGQFWDLVGEIVNSHYKVAVLYFASGIIMAASVFYYVNSEVERDYLSLYILLLPGCFLEYTGLLRQGLAAAMAMFSVGLMFRGKHVLASALAFVSAFVHSSVLIVYLVILLAVLLASGVKLRKKAIAVLGLLLMIPFIDYAFQKTGGEGIQFVLQGYYETYIRDKIIFGDFGLRLAIMWIILSTLGLFSKSRSRKIVFAKVLCGIIIVLYPWFVNISGLAVRALWYLTPFAVPAIHDGLGVLTNRKIANRLLGLVCLGAFSYSVYLAGQSEFVNPVKLSN